MRVIRAAMMVAAALLFLAVFRASLARVPAANYAERDDALITLSHARNLVEYGFVGVSPSGERVEGFSAPLQFLVAGAIYAIRPFDYHAFFRWQLLIGTLVVGALVAGLLSAPAPAADRRWRVTAIAVTVAASAVILANSRAFLLWHASGMENAYKTAGLLAVLWLFDAMLRRERIAWGGTALVLLAALTRIDAIVTVGLLLAAFAAIWTARRRDARGIAFAAACLLFWAAFMAWRASYFGHWDPNTAAAQRIDVAARLAALWHTPRDAVADAWAWFRDVGPALLVFQFAGLPIVLVIARRSPVAWHRAVLLAVAAVSCVAQYVLLGGVRLDPARAVTDLAVFATLASPFVLLAREPFGPRDLAACAALLAAFLAIAATKPPDRGEIGWGTASFELTADRIEGIAREERLPRVALANADLGAISWRKTMNVVDLGALGSTIVPRVDRPAGYVVSVVKPDLIEIHDAWSCIYADLFARAEFTGEYEPIEAARTPWLAANCGAAPSALTGIWIRKAVRKGSLSPERRFIDAFGASLDLQTLDTELAACLAIHDPRPCDYVGRTLYRFAPELKRAGRFETARARLAADPRLKIEHAFLSSSIDPRWWKAVAASVQPPAAAPAKLSIFATLDASRASRASLVVRDPLGVGWRIDAPADVLEVRPASGTGTTRVDVVPRRTAAPTDVVVNARIVGGGETAAASDLSIRFRSVASIASGPPAGAVDAPPDPVHLDGDAVTFQGWAVDPFDMRRVFVTAGDAQGRTIELGEAARGGARPDISALLPNAHDLFNAGWTFVLEPRRLAGLARPVTLHFQAQGYNLTAGIGERTIVAR
jgi:hypothetical protein